jgi:DNA-binding beta-propeller fold protein YncE
MFRTFDCPKCGAPVNYVRNEMLGAQQGTIRCDYCHSSLIAPDESHGQPARIVPITIDLRNLSSRKVTKWIWVLVAIPLFGILMGVLAMLGALAPVFYSISRTAKQPTDSPTKVANNGFADTVLKFGSEGIGPGMFKDARSIAVDGAGRIYVGEYTGGRIQVFDPAGKFITQWSIGDRKTLLRGLAADRKGIVYVVTGGNIRRYEGETGSLLGQVAYEERSGFDDVAVAADGGLVAAWYINRDDIVRFDSNGNVVRTIREAISSASGDSELNTRVAIDGMGNIYALGTFNSAIFKFTPEGKFVNRFSGPGDQPGQLRAASSIAVDGKGRIYACDVKGIQVFDSDGRYLTVFKPDVSSFGMVFNDKNELFVVARKQVIKPALKGD